MTDVLHLPAFRMALACIAQDPQIPATLRERMREHLHALGLTRTLESPEQDALLREIIVWADAQGTSASAMIRKAIGQARAETADHTERPQARRATTQAAFDHAYSQGVSMNTSAEPPQENPIHDLDDDPDWSELDDNPDWNELDQQAALLLHPPWEYGKDRVTKAVNAIKTGHVTLGTPATSLATVTSEDGQRHYTVRENGCTCRATHPCYHMAAAELGRLMEGKKAQPSLFPAPKTVDERLAAPVGAPEATSEAVPSQEPSALPPLDAAPASQEPSMPVSEVLMTPNTFEALTSPDERAAPPSDVTPVTLPGGGERSRDMGQLMAALARAQQRMRNPGYDSRNPHLGSRYLSLAAVRDAVVPHLAAEAIACTQYVVRSEQELLCYTLLGHASGQYLLTVLPMPLSPTGKGMTDSQSRGAVISYAKRYALQAAAGVVGDGDEDGEAMERRTGAGTQDQRQALRHEIDQVLTTHKRDSARTWANAETQYGRKRDELTVADLLDLKERIVRATAPA